MLNVENVKVFLEANHGLDKTTVNQILNCTIDLSEFIEMSASVSFGSSAFCNQSLLFNDLKLQLPQINLGELMVNEEMVTNALCTLSVAEDFKFNNQILNQLVIRKFTNNVSIPLCSIKFNYDCLYHSNSGCITDHEWFAQKSRY